MKGPEVALRYPGPALRGFRDLDLLVPDAPAVQRELLAAGFEPVGLPEKYAAIHHLRPLAYPGLPLLVEVHDRPKWPEHLRTPAKDGAARGGRSVLGRRRRDRHAAARRARARARGARVRARAGDEARPRDRRRRPWRAEAEPRRARGAGPPVARWNGSGGRRRRSSDALFADARQAAAAAPVGPVPARRSASARCSSPTSRNGSRRSGRTRPRVAARATLTLLRGRGPAARRRDLAGQAPPRRSRRAAPVRAPLRPPAQRGRRAAMILRLRPEALQWREIEGEVVAVDLETSSYLGANEAGAVLWRALAAGATKEELAALLVARIRHRRGAGGDATPTRSSPSCGKAACSPNETAARPADLARRLVDAPRPARGAPRSRPARSSRCPRCRSRRRCRRPPRAAFASSCAAGRTAASSARSSSSAGRRPRATRATS